uniref:Small ribosomal subunit protein bS20 n=1 Tax=Candidatus Aschnera chinzeii TaxID=1485666 RepID=A0AAT9G4F0_9ENTR|nr:MAG: 30S ribosomal protein S20 [Candidatus Aschnera chinzeii]
MNKYKEGYILANIKSSKKRAIQSKKRRQQKASKRSTIRTFIKKVQYYIVNGNKNEAEIAFKKMQIIIDKYTSKGILHKNKNARHKSKLSAQLKLM